MILKDLFNKDTEVDCCIELWFGIHDNGGELLEKADGDETDLFEPWYNMNVVYITIEDGKLILEIQ